jgi:hypothetical protein
LIDVSPCARADLLLYGSIFVFLFFAAENFHGVSAMRRSAAGRVARVNAARAAPALAKMAVTDAVR